MIVNSSDSFPLIYPFEERSLNPARNVQGSTNFWLKDNLYSLHDMFGSFEMGLNDLVDEHFVGGTVYQAFLDPWCCHRWYSPISGTILMSYSLPGTYYLANPLLKMLTEYKGRRSYLDSQPMLSSASVRHIFIIRLNDGSNRLIGLI